jgi:hypothetical protein
MKVISMRVKPTRLEIDCLCSMDRKEVLWPAKLSSNNYISYIS